MFGRKRRAQERAFAHQTIDAKHALIERCRAEILQSAWFEDGSFSAGQRALESYLDYLASTENVVYLTVNTLSPSMHNKAQLAASTMMDIVSRPTIPGLGSPAYLAANNMLRDLFDIDPFDETESDVRAADSTLAFGFAQSCNPKYFPTFEGLAQHTAVACALAAGWIQSPTRRSLDGQ